MTSKKVKNHWYKMVVCAILVLCYLSANSLEFCASLFHVSLVIFAPDLDFLLFRCCDFDDKKCYFTFVGWCLG